jgi:hypothetical protein
MRRAYRRDVNMRYRLALGAVVAAGLALPSTSHAATDCGLTPRIDGVRYQVMRLHTGYSCGTVMSVATRYLRDGTAKSPWVCFRGHGSASYAAQCARGSRTIIRVLAPT